MQVKFSDGRVEGVTLATLSPIGFTKASGFVTPQGGCPMLLTVDAESSKTPNGVRRAMMRAQVEVQSTANGVPLTTPVSVTVHTVVTVSAQALAAHPQEVEQAVCSAFTTLVALGVAPNETFNGNPEAGPGYPLGNSIRGVNALDVVSGVYAGPLL